MDKFGVGMPSFFGPNPTDDGIDPVSPRRMMRERQALVHLMGLQVSHPFIWASLVAHIDFNIVSRVSYCTSIASLYLKTWKCHAISAIVRYALPHNRDSSLPNGW